MPSLLDILGDSLTRSVRCRCNARSLRFMALAGSPRFAPSRNGN